MGIITFNGKSSQDYGIQVEHPPEYEIPEREYEIIAIPGRNGDPVIDKGSFKNVNRSYQIAIGSRQSDFTTLANKISTWLHSTSGYARLEDSYEPDYYKIAMYAESNNVQNILEHAGRATINFNRKPERFLKSGEYKTIFNSSGNIFNPTGFVSKPIITVRGNGNGVLHVGGCTVSITNIINFIDIDSDIEDSYNGTTNLNLYVTLDNKEYPKLVPGDNSISFTGGITSVEVMPKWWTI